MPDTLGRITVPTPTPSGLTFPLKDNKATEYGYGMSREWLTVEHRFGGLATLSTQRFFVGPGMRRFMFRRDHLNFVDRAALLDFYTAVSGSFQSFTYKVPNPDRTTFTDTPVIFELQPLSVQHLVNSCRVGITFVEEVDPSAAPIYTISATNTRFPDATLTAALLSQTQQLIPLLHIRVADPAVPDIYLSDRRCTVGPNAYLPRVLDIGDKGSDILLSQDISGAADNIRLTFGNADRAMSLLAKDTSLKFADIDLCFYHVNTGTLLQMWKGSILSWQIDGSDQFSVQCSDILYPLTQSYPHRTITRQCPKTFDDGLRCPFSSAGAHGSELITLGGDAHSCDFGYTTPNGCLAHGMGPYFGGHPLYVQSVSIYDEGTKHIAYGFSAWQFLSPIFGGLRWDRNKITATSVIADNLWGQALPEIWCNDNGSPKNAFWANALVASTRDESTFQDVLGIVGAGPLGGYEGMSVQQNADGYKFIVAPLADGFVSHGFKLNGQLQITGYHPELGLREILGSDPANTVDDPFALGQGTPQNWLVPDPRFGRIQPFAAGTAFVELRYSKPSGKGVTPTAPDVHAMQVPVARGLTGFTFTGAGRIPVPGLTNPFWVAINTYLRAVGMEKADAATQLTLFDSTSVFVGDGTGPAEIADLQVAPIFGTGLETQFQFQGTINEFKPFRDWLTEILSCSLGFYTFNFGKLALGIRSNASAVESFTLGNMLYQSLSITPTAAAFEYLKLDFANSSLQYQMDFGEYNDKDHARHFGRPDAPLTSRTRSVGCSTMSQALRLAATRVREEIGGILRTDQANPYIEWDNANTITFRTTILSLSTHVGQVIEVTHPDLATYPGAVGGSPLASNTWKFRIIRWTLHRDYSVSIQARSVTDSMYDLEVGNKPIDVTVAPLPILFFPEPLGQWAPYLTQYPSADALFPNEYTFDLAQAYSGGVGDTVVSRAIASGRLSVNSFIPNCGAPDVKKGRVSQSTTGGTIPGGTTLRVQVCATDALGRYSAPSDVLILQFPSTTNTNSFTLHDIVWPNVAGLTGYVVFGSEVDDLICGQLAGALSGTTPSYTPIDISVTAAFRRSTYAVPNPGISRIRVKGKRGIHFGVLGAPVTSVTSTKIIAHDVIDGTATDNWTGRVLAMIGRAPLEYGPDSVPAQNFNCTAFDPATGEFTVDRNPSTAGILPDDTFVVCFLGYDNSSTPRVIADAGLSNITNLHTGETADDPNRIGNYVLVIKGLSRGQSAKIISNTSTSYTLERDLLIDSTSVYIVVTSSWERTTELNLDNSDPLKTTQISLDVSNYNRLPMLITGVTVDQDGNEVAESNAPIGMIFIYGAQGTRFVNADTVMRGTDGLIVCDTSTVTQPATDALTAAFTNTSDTDLHCTGTNIVNGTIIQIGTEKMRVMSGTGGTREVERGALGSTPATHLSGATIIVPGYLTVTLLPNSSITPNQKLRVRKSSADINFVKIVPDATDTFEQSGAYLILPDDSAANGSKRMTFPG